MKASTWISLADDLDSGPVPEPSARDGDAVLTVKLIACVVAAVSLVSLLGTGLRPSFADDPDCPGVEIEAGDTLSAISARTGVGVMDLVDHNRIADPDLIRAGDWLCTSSRPIEVLGVSIEVPTYRQRATGCSAGPTVGAQAIEHVLLDEWPSGVTHGIYNCRLSRGGSSYSTHAEGRAVDFGWPSCDADFRAIVGHLVLNHQELGIQRIVACDYEWVVGLGWSVPSDYLQSMHDGRKAPVHAHIELTRQAADELTVDYVREVLYPADTLL